MRLCLFLLPLTIIFAFIAAVASINCCYTVNSGDSLYSIAINHGISLQEMKDANPCIKYPYTIYPNQKITLPNQPYC
uniref:Chitin-binding LysM effector n=1 Tax=Gigaspora margarita TaxID=4874 RepID=A0A5P8I3K5_GIGMA|nr:chitin-binding LysM effector [Gigaspora margarita]